jgi:hypothetical protein
MKKTNYSRFNFLKFGIGTVAITAISSLFAYSDRSIGADKRKKNNSGSIKDRENNSISYFYSWKERPHGLTANDRGLSCVYGQTGNIHQWNGSAWQIISEQVNAKDYGATGDGKTDDTKALITAANAAKNGKILYIPRGIYQTSQQIIIPSNTGGIIGDGANSTIINSRIVQKERVKSSFMLLRGGNGAIFKNFKLNYLGKFNTGSSYSGFVEGLHILDSDNILIDNVEISGFNSSGLRLDGEKKLTINSISKNNRVQNCYLHHNRVSGLTLVWQDGVIITNNILERNGLAGDVGTGYGMACGNSSIVKNAIVTNNITRYNYRKGLDCHEIENIVLANNTCLGDALFGIFVSNTLYPMNSTVIANNIIVCDPIGIPSVRSVEYYTGLFYMCSNIDDDKEKYQEPSLQVTGNSIRELDRQGRTPDKLIVHGIKILNYAKKMSSVTVTDNHVRGTKYCTAVEVTMNYPVFAKNTQVPSEGMQCKISGNQIYADRLDRQAINVDYFDTKNLGNLGQVIIKDNNIRVNSYGASPIEIKRGFQVAVVESNYIDDRGDRNIKRLAPIAIETSVRGSVRIKDNDINITSLSSPSKLNIKSGSNLVSAADNRINGQQIDVIP